MKRLTFAIGIVLYALFFPQQTVAQNESDALRLTSDLRASTARSLGLSNAMTAVGGDVGAMPFNPASIAIFRKSLLSFSPQIAGGSSRATFFGQNGNASASDFSFGSLGIISVQDLRAKNPQSSWRYFNYGFTFNRIRDFNMASRVQGNNLRSSLVDQFLDQANNPSVPFSSQGLNDNYPFSAYPAYMTYLINPTDTVRKLFTSPVPQGGIRQTDSVAMSGSVNEFAIALGGNYDDKLMIGASIFLQSTNFSMIQVFREEDVADTIPGFRNFSYTQNNTAVGQIGIGLRLGLMYQPVKWLRFGMGITTPVAHILQDGYLTRMQTDMGITGQYDYSTPPNSFNYTMTQPFRFNGGVALFPNENWMISLDYEQMALNQIKMSSSGFDDWSNGNNSRIREVFKSRHTIRTGVERRLGENRQWVVRAGFNYSTSPFQSSINTSGADQSAWGIALGGGYRTNLFNFDLGFGQSWQSQYRLMYQAIGLPAVGAVLNNTWWNLIGTLGFRF